MVSPQASGVTVSQHLSTSISTGQHVLLVFSLASIFLLDTNPVPYTLHPRLTTPDPKPLPPQRTSVRMPGVLILGPLHAIIVPLYSGLT